MTYFFIRPYADKTNRQYERKRRENLCHAPSNIEMQLSESNCNLRLVQVHQHDRRDGERICGVDSEVNRQTQDEY